MFPKWWTGNSRRNFMLPERARKELKGIFGKNYREDLPHLIAHGSDATRIEALPDAVVFAEKETQVVETLKLANEMGFAVVPRGSGTGYSGGAVPIKGGVVLSLTKMNRLRIDQQNMVAVAEPGVITEELQREAEKVGLFYPPDPASLKNSTIGGNLAENAGGPRCLKYGVTKNYVLGLRVVLPTGRVLELGRGLQKNVAGYELMGIFIGSEGTLGVITKAWLKLIPKPALLRSMRVDFKTVAQASKAATAILTSGILPSALEFVDRKSLEAVGKYLRMDIAAGACLIIQVDGDEASVISQMNKIKEVVSSFSPLEMVVAEDEGEEKRVWKLRRSISPAINKLKPIKVNEDIVVPRSLIPEAVDFIYSLGEKYGLLVVVFGHMGDGNLHVNFMIEEEEREKTERAVEELFSWIIERGGAISGEHGIGITKAKFLKKQLGEETYNLMKDLKRMLDPKGILNPVKIFTEG